LIKGFIILGALLFADIVVKVINKHCIDRQELRQWKRIAC